MIRDKVAVVTGAAGGIGRRIADNLVRRGANLIVTDLEIDRLAGWPADQVLALRHDVREAEDWRVVLRAAQDRWNRLDYVMNVAGYIKPGRIYETPVDEISRHLDVNAKGVMLGTRLAGELMAKAKQGHIINIGSMAGLAPIPGIGLYAASKFAVRAFSLVAARELKPHGVFVTVVCPEAVQTPMLDLQLDYPEAALTFSGSRVFTAEDVSRAVLGPVLKRKPLEYWLPSYRGWLAKAADALPNLGFKIGDFLQRRGRSAQQRRRQMKR